MKTASPTHRTRRIVRSVGLVAVAAASVFSLTACQDDGGKDKASGSSSSVAASKGNGAQNSGPDANDSGSTGSTGSADSSSSGDGERSGNGGGRGSGGTGGSGGSNAQSGAAGSGTKEKTCDLGTTKVRLQQTGGTAPVILLKATNQGSTRCDLYGYPVLGYPDAQAPIAVGGNKPQAVVSVQPGKSAYAALTLETGTGENMHREKQLTIELADRNGRGTGSPTYLTAPGEGLALSSENSKVSYWNTTPEQAM
ncbi:DUF4232 domain-containing protein [Streptomyces axinellae]|uniref:DUF4232 domain-containing protein n=1 Tax=Streptomyces axinellae TaxID=552788 RepID=A0ABP6C6L5_9ACTN